MRDHDPANGAVPPDEADALDRYLTAALAPPPLSADQARAWRSAIEWRAQAMTEPSLPRAVACARAGRGWAVAGGAALAAAAALWIMRPQGHAPVRGAPSHWRTAAGQQASLTLADGSRVLLAPESRLEVGPRFGTSARMVRLTGQAYFSVATAAWTPFVVHTATVSIRVLGTEFDVRRYRSDSAVRIAVVSGRVRASTSHVATTVTAGRSVRLTDSTATAGLGNDVTSYTSWTAGTLSFDDVPVATVLAALERWYGYTFRLTDSTLAARHVTAVFRVAERERTLALLEHLIDVTLTMRGSTIILTPQRPSVRAAPRREVHPTFTPTLEAGK